MTCPRSPRRYWRRLLSALGMVAGSVAVASGQTVVTLSGEPSCTACEITLKRTVTLGGERSRPWGEMIAPTVTKIGRGRYYVAPTGDPGVIEVFDSIGRPWPPLEDGATDPGNFSRPAGSSPVQVIRSVSSTTMLAAGQSFHLAAVTFNLFRSWVCPLRARKSFPTAPFCFMACYKHRSAPAISFTRSTEEGTGSSHLERTTRR